MIRALLGAVQFLTIVPVRGRTAEPGRSAAFFPLVGAWIGIMGAALLDFGRSYIPFTLAALLVVAFWCVITGGLHEDGLADTADAFRAGRSPDRIMTILKDSRIGTFGGLALLFSLLIRWQSLSAITVTEFAPALAAAQALPRAAFVALAWISRPAGGGLGAAFSAILTTPIALFAIFQAVLFALWCGPAAAAWLLIGMALIVLAARRYFHLRLGGVTGDCLGATGQVVEVYILVLFACRNCIS
ncbi:MAG: adenosylcobinamide-GDP ribazoletransferase [Bryobacteraceae bacterium]